MTHEKQLHHLYFDTMCQQTEENEESRLLGIGMKQSHDKAQSFATSAAQIYYTRIFVAFIGFAVGVMIIIRQQETSPISSNIRRGPSTPLTSTKYSKFQPLNFQIYTGGAPVNILDGSNVTANNPECSDLNTFGKFGGDEGAMYCYMGHKNSTHDVIDRLAIMEDAVSRAYDLSDTSPDTLKIFVAPEFFFRGRNGAYMLRPNQTTLFASAANTVADGEECEAEVCQILVALEKLVSQAKFEDWIFLFGTAIVYEEMLSPQGSMDHLFYNFGILLKGYDPLKDTHEGKRFLIPKRYVSNIDFLTPYRNVIDSTREVFQANVPSSDEAVLNPHNLKHTRYDNHIWYKYKAGISSLGYTMIEYGWLMIEGITLTVEICLDHDMHIALTAFLADAASPTPTLIPSYSNNKIDMVEIPQHQAQISIVSSAEMNVNPTSLVLADGGTIILQDGMNDDEINMTWTYDCGKYDWEFSGGSEVLQRNVSITPDAVAFQYELHRDYRKYSIYGSDWKESLRGVFSGAKYEPMVTAYEPRMLALL